MTKLTSDDNFQASKKKNMASRKKGENMYAIKKPERALFAMFATHFMSSAKAEWEINETYGTKVENYDHDEYDKMEYVLMILFTLMIGMFIWFCIKCSNGWTMTWTPTTTRNEPPAETKTTRPDNQNRVGGRETDSTQERQNGIDRGSSKSQE